MVSLRPPLPVSTSQSKDLRWMSMRLGTSMAFSRDEKLRRGGEASRRAKTATPWRSRFGGGARGRRGVQSATDEYSRKKRPRVRGGCGALAPAHGRHGPRPEAPDMWRGALEGRLRLLACRKS